MISVSMDLTKDELKSLIRGEINKVLESELDKRVSSLLKKANSGSNKETLNITKDALENLFKALYLKRMTWKKEI
jgi:hypothetical protein